MNSARLALDGSEKSLMKEHSQTHNCAENMVAVFMQSNSKEKLDEAHGVVAVVLGDWGGCSHHEHVL